MSTHSNAFSRQDQLNDTAKYAWAVGATDLWETSLELADWARSGKISKPELWAVYRRLLSVMKEFHAQTMSVFSGGATIDPDEVYSDGSPIWTRVIADGLGSDPALVPFQSGDMHHWVSGKSGPLPLGVKVAVNSPPAHRDAHRAAPAEQRTADSLDPWVMFGPSSDLSQPRWGWDEKPMTPTARSEVEKTNPKDREDLEIEHDLKVVVKGHNIAVIPAWTEYPCREGHDCRCGDIHQSGDTYLWAEVDTDVICLSPQGAYELAHELLDLAGPLLDDTPPPATL